MNTISVLLPVHNAQGKLADGVKEVLDLLSELARQFELWILDDGSNDDTAEVARQLSAEFPQVRCLRHPVRLGLCEAIQTGLDHAHGDVILVGDEDYCLDPEDLRTLWQLRDTQWQMSRLGSLPAMAREPEMQKLLATRPRANDNRTGFQMILRQAFEQFRLEQALEGFHRIDARTQAGGKRSSRPKFLRPSRSFSLDE